MGYQYTPIRMAEIQNSDSIKGWQGYGIIGTLAHCWWECKWYSTLEDSVVVSYKIKHPLTM